MCVCVCVWMKKISAVSWVPKWHILSEITHVSDFLQQRLQQRTLLLLLTNTLPTWESMCLWSCLRQHVRELLSCTIMAWRCHTQNKFAQQQTHHDCCCHIEQLPNNVKVCTFTYMCTHTCAHPHICASYLLHMTVMPILHYQYNHAQQRNYKCRKCMDSNARHCHLYPIQCFCAQVNQTHAMQHLQAQICESHDSSIGKREGK